MFFVHLLIQIHQVLLFSNHLRYTFNRIWIDIPNKIGIIETLLNLRCFEDMPDLLLTEP